MKRILKSIPPPKVTDRVYATSGKAIANKKYLPAIRILEKYAEKYALSENEMYRLALLHDHAAMHTNQEKKFGKRTTRVHLARAERLYRDILEKNPKYLHALYGIGRVLAIRGKFRQALRYEKDAYRFMLKLPKRERGALGIGSLYEHMHDFKNAERWHLKERHACLATDFGTALNLFWFYKRTRDSTKALRYARETERLMKREFRKKAYGKLKMRQSKFVTSLKNEIKELKTKGLQKE